MGRLNRREFAGAALSTGAAACLSVRSLFAADGKIRPFPTQEHLFFTSPLGRSLTDGLHGSRLAFVIGVRYIRYHRARV